MLHFSSESQPLIEFERFEDGREERREVGAEITGDFYVAVLTTRQSRVEVICNGKPLQTGLVVPGMARLAAPGERLEIVLHGRAEALTIKIPGPALRAMVLAVHRDHRAGAFSYIDPLPRPNAQVAQLAQLLLHQEDFGPAHASLFLQGVTQTLLAYLLHSHGWTRRPPSAARALSAAELRRAFAFADASMADALASRPPLTLETWAATLRLPVAEFRQRFQAATGRMPYAWYVHRRIERAKEMLVSSKDSLTEIAISVGFSSQSHFTEAFRRLEGMPPARWRDQRRRGVTRPERAARDFL